MASGKILFCDVVKGVGGNSKPYVIYNGVVNVVYGERTDTKFFSVFGNTGVVPAVGQDCEVFDFNQNKNKDTGEYYGDFKYRAMFIRDKDGRYLKV